MQRAFHSEWLPYLLYVPNAPVSPRPEATLDERSSAGLPLIVFLHGSGERGSDPNQLKACPLPSLLEAQGDFATDFPFVVLSPQCPHDTRWTQLSASVNALLDRVLTQYPIDPARVYLTGFSMGGQGVWHIASLYPERFAAIVPVAARIPPRPNFLTGDLCKLSTVPVWTFHSETDEAVPSENSTRLVMALEECGGRVYYTLYPDATHKDSALLTYRNVELYNWLLIQRRN